MEILTIGHAAYDLTFTVPHHPGEDEKCIASALLESGGGPAANAAVTIARLGHRVGFCGYLGDGHFGEAHLKELQENGVETRFVVRGKTKTPLSVALVKPGGKRTLVNYRAGGHLPAEAVDLTSVAPRGVLFDGHERFISLHHLSHFRKVGSQTVLDAGSLHAGTEALMFEVDHLVASEKFACQFLGRSDPEKALKQLAERARGAVVITLGERGLIWQREGEQGEMPAFEVKVVDTTGAGDVFHGAFMVGLIEGMAWLELLRFASATAALSCTRLGARPSIPYRDEVERFLKTACFKR